MLTTKEAIAKRRSIRKFKDTPVPEETLLEILDSARLAPSGCNAQPWRFKIVTDAGERKKIAVAAAKQMFIAHAPAVIVACVDIKGYLEGSVSGVQDLAKQRITDPRVAKIIEERTEKMAGYSRDQLGLSISFNIAIAVEHIALRALDFGLGTCWVRLFDEAAVRAVWGLDDNLFACVLMPIGVPDQNPEPRARKTLKEIIL
jgi:nitroreductase